MQMNAEVRRWRGKVFMGGRQALSAQAGVYFNAVDPDNLPTSDWTAVGVDVRR
jgi:hypothetical protein